MFIAQSILGEIAVNYDKTQDIPYNLPFSGVRPLFQHNKIKNVCQPLTQYHNWLLETGGVECDRNKIIDNLRLGKKIKKIIKTPEHTNSILDVNNNGNIGDGNNGNISDDGVIESKNDIVLSETDIKKLFTLLESINWCDKDERIMTMRNIKNLTTANFEWLIPTMINLADKLYCVVQRATGSVDYLDSDEKYNFLFHVMGKGEQFYNNSIIDPSFCTYLLPDEYQPLWSFIKQKFKLKHNE
jgi:hypothetical protein